MDQIRGVMALLITLGIVITISGFFGHVHPAFDSIAAFRIQSALGFALCFVLAVAFVALVARALALTGLVIGVFGILPFVVPEAPINDPDLVVYSHNLRYDNSRIKDIAAAARARGADVLLLQEVAEANRELMSLLDRDYPEQAYCPFSGIGGVAILSTKRFRGETGCARGQGMVWATLGLGGGDTVTVASLHLSWPWPHGQAAHATTVAEIVAELPHPLVIGGDFNMAPWGDSVDRIASASATKLVGGLRLSYHRPSFWPGLPLDHVLASPSLAAETILLDRFGSDHSALLTRIRLDGLSL